MNILIATGIFPPDIGGPATYVPTLAAALAARGHDVTVITTSDRAGTRDDGPYRVLRIRRSLPLPLKVLLVVWTIFRRGRRADVLVTNGMDVQATLANLLLRRPLAIKVVGDWVWERARNQGWTDETFDTFQQRRHGGRLGLLCRLRDWCVRRAAVVIVPSHFLGRTVAAWGVPPPRIQVIANAVAPSDHRSPPEIPLPPGERVIVVGRLVPWKRVDALIRALDAWPAPVGLIIVGDGPERERLAGLADRLGVARRVWFAGTRTPSDVASLLAASTVFVLNSTYEGLPHAALEAMEAGVPIVATDAGGTREAVDDGVTGVLIPPGDEAALPRAVAGLLADPARRRAMAARAREAAAARFAPERMIRETESVLDALGRAGRRVCFIGAARYGRPIDHASREKFTALAPLARLSVVAFSDRLRFRRFTEVADLYLIPSPPWPLLRYLAMGSLGTSCLAWCVLVRGADTIVAQSPYEGFLGAVVKRMASLVGRRVALVIESHGDFEEDLFLQRTDLPVGLYRALMRATARIAFGASDVLRAVSSSTRMQLQRAAPGKPCVEFVAWTDLDAFRRAGEAAVERSAGGRILFAGGIFPRKGVHVLIEALRILWGDGHRNVELRIAGQAADPRHAEGLRATIAELGLPAAFLGHLAQDRLAREMRLADVFVLPSLSEGLGRVLFEAQLCGALVIGANVGGIPDLVEDGQTGLLVPAGDAAALADRLRWALDHPAMAREIACRGQAFARRTFSVDRYVDGYAAVFARAAAVRSV